MFKHLNYFYSAKSVQNRQIAVKDATAKSIQGILRGSTFQFGHFEECLSARAPFPTQYCLTTLVANVPPPDPPRDPKSLDYDPRESVLKKIYDHKDPSQQPENVVQLGWCMPATCSHEDLEEYLNDYLKNSKSIFRNANVTYVAYVRENSCQKQDEKLYFDQVDVSFCLVTLIIVVLVIGSTICDVGWKHEDKFMSYPLQELLTAFSIRRNYHKLTESEETNPALKLLYGMRVFCIFMIIIDHRFGTFLSIGILNFNNVEENFRTTFGTLFFHGDLFVDSFFILSGILVTYCLLVQFEKKPINSAVIVLMRYVRLTPLYAYVIFFCATLFDFTGNGPMWKTVVTPEVQDCRQNWWANILYVSNYVNSERMALLESIFGYSSMVISEAANLVLNIIAENKSYLLDSLGNIPYLNQNKLIQFSQDELNQIVTEWDAHQINSSRNSIAPKWRPFIMYHMPQIYDCEDFLCYFEEEALDNSKHLFEMRSDIPCDKDVYNLATIIMA